MAGPLDSTRRHDDNPWTRSPGHAGGYVDTDEEEEPALYRTDEFRIRVMKVLKCSKKYCHDWTRCPFAHPGEKATRRDPMLGTYTGIACPDMKKDQRCPRGQYCPYAHNVFEYWLHPTRYRTALCRDVERCTRKICFFAHAVHEIRTNVERPYVSPEQLVHASEMAAADPRVQAEYKAAAEEPRRGSKPGLMTGLFNSLDDPADSSDPPAEQLQSLNLSLRGPAPSEENQEMMQALSSLMRGDMGPLSNPYMSSSAMAATKQNSGNFRIQTTTGAGPHASATGGVPGLAGLSPLDQRIRRIASDPISRQNPRTATQGFRQQEADMRSISMAQSVNTIAETGPAMFPDHLNTMVQTASHQKRASQQNLANAAAHLLMEPTSKEQPSIWSTPVSPLDLMYSTLHSSGGMEALHSSTAFDQLYSTASTCSDRRSSLEGQASGALEAAYRQKLQKRMAERQAQEAASALNGGLGGASGLYGLQSGPRDALLHSMPAAYGSWSLNPNLEFAMAIQKQQQQAAAIQNQAYLHSIQDMWQQQEQQQRQQEQQHAYEQEIRNKLQQAIQTELRNQQGMSRPSTAKVPRAPAVETGFDLRFGGLGEHQGLLSQPPPEVNTAARPNLLQTTAAHFFTAPASGHADFSAPDFLKQMAASEAAISRKPSLSPRGEDSDGSARSPMTHPQKAALHGSVEAALAALAESSSAAAVQPPVTTTINA